MFAPLANILLTAGWCFVIAIRALISVPLCFVLLWLAERYRLIGLRR